MHCIARLLMAVITGVLVTSLGSCQDEPVASWRSALYPEDWTPEFEDAEGRFLHDFSYAGYHYGEKEPPVPGSPVFDVTVGYGADNSGNEDATDAIQQAIDAATAAGGGIVSLPEGLYRCDGTLIIRGDHVVLRGAGPEKTRVFFSLVEGMARKNHITFQGRASAGEEYALAEDGRNRAFSVRIADATGISPGDDVALGWVITDAFIDEHGMMGTWKAFNGEWRAFFRRTVTRVDTENVPHTVYLDVPLRYDAKTRDNASLRKETGYLCESGIEELSVSNAGDWDAAWKEAGVHVLGFIDCCDCWARNVASFCPDSDTFDGYHLQNGGIKVLDSKRMTIDACSMERAQNRGGGGCGYLYEVSRSSEVLFRDCYAKAGRHNFIQNWDFGTSGCVWLRCISSGSRNVLAPFDPVGLPAYCEYHHSLAMANLVDQCVMRDGWFGGNRHDWSTGAGATVTQSVYWNTTGGGKLRSWQTGWGYIIGTKDMSINTDMGDKAAEATAPEDYVEGKGQAAGLQPPSLYEDQHARRMAAR